MAPSPATSGDGAVVAGSFKSYVNSQALRDPMPYFPDSVGKSENGPRLPLGKGATFVPKVMYFTVYFLAGSHRLRAGVPDMHESSIALADLGCPDEGANVHGKTRHF